MFRYQIAAEKVFVFWDNRHVKTLTGHEAAAFLARVESASDADAQLAMAKVTGNFKRGNERHKPGRHARPR